MWTLFPAAAALIGLAVLAAFLRSPAGRERRRGMIGVAVVAVLFAAHLRGILAHTAPGARPIPARRSPMP
jgi:hypothetical protein